jgi:hypothetical protein
MDEATTGEISKVRDEYRAGRRKGAYFWIIAAAWGIIAPALAILVSRQISIDAARDAARQSELKLCAIVVTADDGYRANPPVSTTLKKQAENMAALRRDYHCPPSVGVGK